MKRLYSLILAVVMTVSMLIPISVFADGDGETTTPYSVTIKGQDAYTEKTLDVSKTGNGLESDNGQTVQLSASADCDLPQTIKYEFTVSTAGAYSINLVANRFDTTYLSKYYIKIDGKQYNVDANTCSYKTTSIASTHIFDMNLFKYANLSEGKHTFELCYNVYRYSDTTMTTNKGVLGFLDSVKFTYSGNYKAVINYLDTKTTDNLTAHKDYATINKSVQKKSYASTGAELKLLQLQNENVSDESKFPSEGFYIDFEFDVDVEGLYNLSKFIGTNVEHSYLSNQAIAVDGGAVTKITSNRYTSVNPLDSATLSNGALSCEYATNLNYYFTKGTHHFKFILPELNCGSMKRVLAYFNTAEFTLVDETKSNMTSVFYGQDYYKTKSADLTVKTNDGTELTNNKKAIKITSAKDVSKPQEIEWEFDIVKSGAHKLTFASSLYGVDYLSKYDVYIDGKKYDLNANTVESQTVQTGGATNNILYDIVLKERLNLKQGKHTFKISFTSERADGGVYAFFESAKFENEGAYKEVIYCTDERLDNLSDYPAYDTLTVNSNSPANVNASDDYANMGTIYAIHTNRSITTDEPYDKTTFPKDGYYLDYAFDVEVAGVYNLSTFIGNNYNNAWLSKLAVTVDNEVVRTLNDTWCTSTTIVDTKTTAGIKNICDYVTDMSFYLTEGEHHFKIIIPEACYNRLYGTYVYFNKAVLTYVAEKPAFGSATITVPKYANVGESAGTVSVGKTYSYDNSEEEVTLNGVRLISYASSNEKVLTVDTDGNIVPVGRGMATVTAYVTYGGIVVESETSDAIYVTEDNLIGFVDGIYSNDTKIYKLTTSTDGIEARFTLHNSANGTPSCIPDVYVAIYEGDTLTMFVKSDCADNLVYGENKLTVPVSGFEVKDNTKIKFFVWDGKNAPIIKSMEIGV